MEKFEDFIYTILGIVLIATLILITYRSLQPEPIRLDFTEQPQTEEHILVSEILSDTEAFVAEEDARFDQTQQPELTAPVPLPVAGAPLPVAWDSKPAPNLDETALSPSLQRSLAASASLRTDEYTDPTSELNLKRVEDIRKIRKNRHQTK